MLSANLPPVLVPQLPSCPALSRRIQIGLVFQAPKPCTCDKARLLRDNHSEKKKKDPGVNKRSSLLAINRLSNSGILENKAHLAILQARMKVPTLEVRA
jgi:hypothetical protein